MKTPEIALEANLIGVSVGIRFRANFSLDDQLGRIVDSVLYPHDSFFNPQFFPTVLSELTKRTLVNNKSENLLIIDNSNFILDLKRSKGGSGTFSSEVGDVLAKFESQIVLRVMKEFKIHEINRVGLIKKYRFSMPELAKAFITNTIGGDFSTASDIHLNFTKKNPMVPALVDREVKDYTNAICNITKKAGNDEIHVSVDYQNYFDPFLPDAAEIKFSHFVKEAESFGTNRFLPWLKARFGEG